MLFRSRITFDDKPLPFPENMDDTAARAALGALPVTPLKAGVLETVRMFTTALANQQLVYNLQK